MIYTLNKKNGHSSVDVDIVVSLFMNSHHAIVCPYDEDARLALIEFLESEGFEIIQRQSRGRAEIINSFLPLVINLETKCITMVGNITCAAAVASHKTIIGAPEFFILYNLLHQQDK